MFVTKNSGQQTHDRVYEHNGGDRAIWQNVITDRNLEIDKMLDHALVDAFVMTADDDEMRFFRQICRYGLIKASSSRRHQNDFRFWRSEILRGREDWFRFHHHPLPAAKRRVVNEVVVVGGPIAQ